MCHWPSMTMQTYETKWETSDSCWISWHLRKQTYDSCVTHMSADFHNSITYDINMYLAPDIINYTEHWVETSEKTYQKPSQKHVTENYPVKNLWILQGIKIRLKTFSIYWELSGKKAVKELTCEKRKYELTDSKPLKKVRKSLW